MSSPDRPFLSALAVSLLVHALALYGPPAPTTSSPPATPPLQASLRPPPAALASPEFIVPAAPEESAETAEKPVTAPAPTEKPRKSAVDRKNAPKTWTEAIRDQFAAQQRAGLFYPPAAIRQGLEGEALVLLLIDTQGTVVAARIETSSGHALLDEAALQAVRRLRTLPADAPQETLLPVRFRLR